MLRKAKHLLAFLTIIPVGMSSDCLIDAANCMYLFPLVGALIGLLAGIFAWLLLNVLESPIVGILTLGFIQLITGLHHTDGLLDFGDGIMYVESFERKIEVMHDQRTGAGGLALGLVTMLATAFSIAQLKHSLVIQGLVASEASAKLAMVVMARIGRSSRKGMNTPFVNALHGQHRNARILTAVLITSGTTVLFLNLAGLVVVIASIAAAFVLTAVSNRHFGGVTGDVFGATNEISRLASLIAILVIQ